MDFIRFDNRNHHPALFMQGNNHINGIGNFRGQVKYLMRKYNGIPEETFLLFLKE